MIALKSLVRAALAAACVAGLAGCVSLVPKTKPAQLYRFGGETAPHVPAAAQPASRFDVYKAPGTFARAASGDRILTVTGDRVAYIAQARWVAPAQILFDEAVVRAFDDNAGSARLAYRGESARTDFALRLDVRNFEAVYDQGAEAAPVVVVRLRAVLTRNSDRTVAGEQLIEARVRADDNRVSAISRAFDAAAADVIGRLVTWTNQQGAPSA
jgi:cholesterol transport system auxiliary component